VHLVLSNAVLRCAELALQRSMAQPLCTELHSVAALQACLGYLSLDCVSGRRHRRTLSLSIIESGTLLMAAKQGPNVLFCMPNRTNCILLVSVML
jgi:hypothetical protein